MKRSRRAAASPSPARANVAGLFDRARASHVAGRFAEAETLYRGVLAADPGHADSLHGLGVLAGQTGRPAAARDLIGRAIAIRPLEPAYHVHLGNTLRVAGQLAEAIDAHRRALALKPDYADALVNLSLALNESGQSEEAAAVARRALAVQPHSTPARLYLSAALSALGRFDEALAVAIEATRSHPPSAAAFFNLGNIASDAGRPDEAEAAFLGAVGLEPRLWLAHYNLGVAQAALGKTEAARDSYLAALAIAPTFAWGHNNLGCVFREEGRIGDAEASYREATRLQPDFAEAHGNRATALYELGLLREAHAANLEALRLKARGRESQELVGSIVQIPRVGPDAARVLSNQLMWLHYDERVSNAEAIAATRRYGEMFGTAAATFANDRSPARRLRVGYVSADFRQHAVGYFLAGVLEARDADRFEIFLYANSGIDDRWTRRLRRAADHWRDIANLSDAAARALMLADGVDILVDLSGHTANNRLPLFATRPAPVQASWLGYFGATGLGAIDYLVMDSFAVRDGEASGYPEAIARLPRGRFCYCSPDDAPAPVEPPSASQGYVTFGSFNHIAKIGDGVVASWAEILKATPMSRLVLKWATLSEPAARDRLVRAFAARGIAADRLELRGVSPFYEMLGQYGDLDVALDPFPFGGGLTSCEALWMGVPVVTWPGDRPASRQTQGFLADIGLGECVADSAGDYVARATSLAADGAKRAELRRSLRARMAASPLCDGPRFARALEASYIEMWRRWTAGLEPQGFDVSSIG